MNHVFLKDLLLEMPQLGSYLEPDAAANIQRVLSVKINTGELGGSVKLSTLDGGFFFVHGLANGAYDVWMAMFHKIDNGNELCFASCLKQTNWLIDDLVTYKVEISKRFTSFPKHSAATAYVEWVRRFPEGVVLTSDKRLSEQGAGVWKELLTRPDLHEEVFVWNTNEKRRETVLDWNDVFGHEERYTDLVVALKTLPQK